MKNISNIVIVVVAVVVIGAGVTLAGYFTDWFGLNVQTFVTLKLNGDEIKNGTFGLIISSGSEIVITSDKEYTVTVKAHSTESNDFEVYIGNELYTWKDLDGRDLTQAFTIKDNVITFGSIHDIVQSAVPGYTVFVSTVPENAADMFELTITSGNASVSVLFTVPFEADEGDPPVPPKPDDGPTIELDPDHIVF